MLTRREAIAALAAMPFFEKLPFLRGREIFRDVSPVEFPINEPLSFPDRPVVTAVTFSDDPDTGFYCTVKISPKLTKALETDSGVLEEAANDLWRRIVERTDREIQLVVNGEDLGPAVRPIGIVTSLTDG